MGNDAVSSAFPGLGSKVVGGEVSIAGDQPWDRIRDYRISVPVRFAVGERVAAIVVPSIVEPPGIDIEPRVIR